MAAGLSTAFRTITVDLRGHGASGPGSGTCGYDECARDLIECVKEQGLGTVAAVGWSMGVSVLIRANTMNPGIFDPLVFISGNPCLVTRPDYPCGIPEVAVRRLYRQVERSYPEGLHNFYGLLLTEAERADYAHDPGYAAMTDPARAPEKGVALGLLECLLRDDLRSELARIRMPALIMHGSEDAICNPNAAEYMHDAITGSRLVRFEKTGHMPFLTRRHEAARHLHDFFESAYGGH